MKRILNFRVVEGNPNEVDKNEILLTRDNSTGDITDVLKRNDEGKLESIIRKNSRPENYVDNRDYWQLALVKSQYSSGWQVIATYPIGTKEATYTTEPNYRYDLIVVSKEVKVGDSTKYQGGFEDFPLVNQPLSIANQETMMITTSISSNGRRIAQLQISKNNIPIVLEGVGEVTTSDDKNTVNIHSEGTIQVFKLTLSEN